jgi:2-oxoisovalerate dehydrogenase E1 component alpha subunit
LADRDRDHSALLPPREAVCLLAADGTRRSDKAFPLDVSGEEIVDLYRWMVITRAVDAEAINLQRQGQLAVYPSSLGQEAAQVGAAAALADGDWIFPSYRELGMALVRGVDPIGLLHMFRGTWLADHDPFDRRFGLLTIAIATQVLHATGFAMGLRLDAKDDVVVACLGDGATSEGDAHEAMTFAGVFGAPVVFFVQNNQYAISVPVDRQTAAPTIAHKAIGYGMRGYRCDGNDVLGTYAVMRAAVRGAREGAGPALVEAVTYRREAHTTSDDAGRYRSEDEVAAAEALDPIERLAVHLRATGLLDDTLEREVAEAAARRAADVRTAVYDAPAGDPGELFAHVYVEPDGHFDGQPAALAARLERGGG